MERIAMMTTLAPPVVGAGSTASVLLWVGALMGVILVGGIVVLWLRRRYHESGGPLGSMETLSLEQLRELRASGRVSEEEFEMLKGVAVRAHGGRAGAAAGAGGPTTAAKPGFDLTGEPLPGSGGSAENEDGRETPGEDGA